MSRRSSDARRSINDDDDFNLKQPDAESRRRSQLREEALIKQPEEALIRQREEALIKQLRDEAYAVRDCFTRYSFQGLTVATIGLGVIAKVQIDSPYLGLLCILPILLMLCLVRMGIHKYSTSNRLLGYELHLQRTRSYSAADGWHPYMREIGWEEAMRAWRVVNATLFEKIYTVPRSSAAARSERSWRHRLWRLRPELVRPEFQEERWFEPSSLLIGAEAEHATYYAGGYLRSILSVIGVAVVASIAVMGLAVVNAWTNPDKGWLPAVTRSQLAFVVRIDEWLSTVVFIVIVILVGLRWSLVSRRLENLEGGLLCIHSSAIVWEAAVLAHFNALRRLGWTPPSEASTTLPTFKGYTKALGAEAHQIAEYATDIHVWLERQRQPAPSPPVVTTPESPHAT